jgi:signal transduction histidine kinase
VQIAEMMAGLRGVFRPMMSGNNPVSLIFDDVDPALMMCTDDGKITQVVRNFVSNAVKFTERGEIHVGVSKSANDMVRFSVSDTGMGIAPEDQTRVFEEFGQVENSRQRHVRGTGLGLSLARTIARLLNGSIGLESQLGAGSTFWLEVPRVDERARPECEETLIDIGVLR